MSDSRNHVEIEDVLSSIRRLVSQDGQVPNRAGLFRAPDSLARSPAAAPEPAAADCLVLTPALRVVPSDAPQQVTEGMSRAADDVAATAPDDEGPYDAGAPGMPAGIEGGGHGDLDLAWQVDNGAVPLEADAAGETGAELAPDWAMAAPEPAPDLREELSRLESTIAELEAAVAASDDAFEPDRGDAFADSVAAPGLAAVFEQVSVDLLPESAGPPDAIYAPDTLADGGPEVAPVAEIVEWIDPVDPSELELTASDWVGDEPETEAETAAADPAHPRRLHLADAQPEEQRPEPLLSSYEQMQSDVADDLFAAENASAFGDEDPLIDEESLRALVSEIIRQELQGTLGERITRSVRKLVRREISRAMASRDFE